MAKATEGRSAKDGPANQAILVPAGEFGRTTFARGATVLIHFSQEQFEALTAGLKPRAGLPPLGGGLHIIPIPGQSGFVGFPVCGPDEVPVFRNGQVRCVPSAFEDTTEPKEPIPGTGCSWTLDTRGRMVCTGTCTGGIRCSTRLQYTGAGFVIACRCPVRRTDIPAPALPMSE